MFPTTDIPNYTLYSISLTQIVVNFTQATNLYTVYHNLCKKNNNNKQQEKFIRLVAKYNKTSLVNSRNVIVL